MIELTEIDKHDNCEKVRKNRGRGVGNTANKISAYFAFRMATTATAKQSVRVGHCESGLLRTLAFLINFTNVREYLHLFISIQANYSWARGSMSFGAIDKSLEVVLLFEFPIDRIRFSTVRLSERKEGRDILNDLSLSWSAH